MVMLARLISASLAPGATPVAKLASAVQLVPWAQPATVPATCVPANKPMPSSHRPCGLPVKHPEAGRTSEIWKQKDVMKVGS
jgi:hypothetical protein